MKAKKELLDYIEYLAYQYDKGNVRSMRESIKAALESYAKKQITDAICDYIQDKSDKAHINTLEDWVEDWIKSQNE